MQMLGVPEFITSMILLYQGKLCMPLCHAIQPKAHSLSLSLSLYAWLGIVTTTLHHLIFWAQTVLRLDFYPSTQLLDSQSSLHSSCVPKSPVRQVNRMSIFFEPGHSTMSQNNGWPISLKIHTPTTKIQISLDFLTYSTHTGQSRFQFTSHAIVLAYIFHYNLRLCRVS